MNARLFVYSLLALQVCADARGEDVEKSTVARPRWSADIEIAARTNGQVQLRPLKLDMGKVYPGQSIEQKFELRNRIGRAIAFKELSGSCSCLKSAVENAMTESGNSVDGTVRFDVPPTVKGSFRYHLSAKPTDADVAELRIEIVGRCTTPFQINRTMATGLAKSKGNRKPIAELTLRPGVSYQSLKVSCSTSGLTELSISQGPGDSEAVLSGVVGDADTFGLIPVQIMYANPSSGELFSKEIWLDAREKLPIKMFPKQLRRNMLAEGVEVKLFSSLSEFRGTVGPIGFFVEGEDTGVGVKADEVQTLSPHLLEFSIPGMPDLQSDELGIHLRVGEVEKRRLIKVVVPIVD